MSLPQTVYFSISNFWYKLTQPIVQCTLHSVHHRFITDIEGQRGPASLSVESTLHRGTGRMTMIYEHAACTAVERCQAGGLGQVAVSIQSREPKKGQQKIWRKVKTTGFFHVALIMLWCSTQYAVCRADYSGFLLGWRTSPSAWYRPAWPGGPAARTPASQPSRGSPPEPPTTVHLEQSSPEIIAQNVLKFYLLFSMANGTVKSYPCSLSR